VAIMSTKQRKPHFVTEGFFRAEPSVTDVTVVTAIPCTPPLFFLQEAVVLKKQGRYPGGLLQLLHPLQNQKFRRVRDCCNSVTDVTVNRSTAASISSVTNFPIFFRGGV